MRQPRWLLPLLRLLVVGAVLAAPALAFARAGGGGGYHGGGGGGHGGGGGYHGGGGHGGGGGGGGLIFDLIYLCFRYPVIGIPVLIIVVLLIIAASRQGTQSYQSSVIRRGGAVLEGNRREDAIAAIQSHDPAFDEGAFKSRVAAAFMKIQNAWCAQDLKSVRPFISDGVHERFSLQFDEQRAEGYRDQMRDVAIEAMAIADAESDAIYDELAVNIRARASDAHVSITDGRPVPGGDAAVPFVEIWSFLRRRGATTVVGKPGLIEGNCPNCGAPIEVNESANCSRCGALLRSGEYDWVLTEITQECEWDGAGHADVPGLRAVRQRDPDFNVQALEDRTSVAYWRKVAAERTGKIDLLRNLVSPAYCDAVAARWAAAKGTGRTYFAQCAVGSVRVLGLVPAAATAGVDRALVEVRWSGRPFVAGGEGRAVPNGPDSVRRTLFVLIRQSDSKTDVVKGVSSAHCPNCGAPESGGASGACAFCGTVLNDGRHGWVLDAALAFSDARAQALLARLEDTETEAPAGAADNAGYDRGAAALSATGNGGGGSVARVAPGSLGLLSWAIRVAYADGKMDDSERQLLAKFAQARNVPPRRLEQLIGAAQSGAIETSEPANAEEAREWLTAMAATAGADGRLDPSEFAVLRALGDKVGLSDNDVRNLVRQARSNQYSAAADALKAARDGNGTG